MCRGRMSELIRSRDQLGVPVSLNMNGSHLHQTFVGGCCSVIVIVMICSLFISSMLQVFVNFNYSLMAEDSYMRMNDGHGAFEISTDDVIPAIQILNMSRPNTTLTISDYVVPF